MARAQRPRKGFITVGYLDKAMNRGKPPKYIR
jgi:hypothetical protein